VISDVIHEAVLDVDEEGTTAAAATGVIMSRALAVPHPPTLMRVDRPFVCVLRDNATGTVLFAGVIRDPQ
jgi:serpin B